MLIKVRFTKDAEAGRYGLTQKKITVGTSACCIGAVATVHDGKLVTRPVVLIVDGDRLYEIQVSHDDIEYIPMDGEVEPDFREHVLNEIAVVIDMAIESEKLGLGKLSRMGRIMDKYMPDPGGKS